MADDAAENKERTSETIDGSSPLAGTSKECGFDLLSPPNVVEFPSSAVMSPIDIEICNGRFIVYRVEHAQILLDECRMVGEVVGICPDKPMDPLHNGPPYMFMPEQVSVLLEYGILPSQPRKDYPTKSRKVVNDGDGSGEVVPREMAVQVAKGRKAKQLKRKAIEDGNSRALKVRRCDLVDIEVTEEEVDAVFKELLQSKQTPPPHFDNWIVPLFEVGDDLYEVVDSPPFADDLTFRRRLCVFRDLWRRGYYLTDGFKFGCDYLLYDNKPSLVHSKFMVKCFDANSCIRPLDMAVLSRVSSQVNKLILLAIVSSDIPFPYYIQCSWWNS